MAQFNDYNSLLSGLNVSGTGFNTANSTPVINTPSNDPFAVRRQELRDNSDNGTEELTHRAPASGYGTLGTQPTGGRDVSISMVEFNAVIEGIVSTRPLLKPQDIPALLRFGVAPEVVQRVELKADLLVLTRQVEAHDLKLIKQ
ncbi:hypothetical protein BT69DRAFT_522609 [Atractiella rhizophila]|nr:hypothetical protein BT69DRAFT_522609 [Atractiella rhizophila]